MDNTTGVVQTKKSLDALTGDDLPLVLKIQARDNPSSAKGNKQETKVVVSSSLKYEAIQKMRGTFKETEEVRAWSVCMVDLFSKVRPVLRRNVDNEVFFI